jgi:hypothetical protein
MGFHVRLLDLLNERSLTLDEVEQFAHILYGEDQITHSIHDDYKGFCADILRMEQQSKAPLCFSPVKLKKCPWIDVRKLKHPREGSMYGMLKDKMRSSWSLGK